MENASLIALSRLIAEQRAMDVTAGNLANAGTPGYRAERTVFADWLLRQHLGTEPRGGGPLAFTQDRATYREPAEGTLTHTGNPLDLALSGEGFFTVQTANGPRLTRAGRFTLGANGGITDESGNALLDISGQKMQITPTDTRLSVAGDGTLSSENGRIGRIGIVVPTDPYRMTAEGSRLFRADAPTRPVTAPKLVQGAVEESNVQPIAELTRMMATERDFQFVTQFVEAEDTRRQTAIDHIAATDATA